jgi:hypothetical protein
MKKAVREISRRNIRMLKSGKITLTYFSPLRTPILWSSYIIVLESGFKPMSFRLYRKRDRSVNGSFVIEIKEPAPGMETESDL